MDGKADDWTKAAFAPIADGLKGAMQVSGDRLHCIVIASGNARYADYLSNVTAVDKLLFKGGGALDLQLGVDPKADPKRQQPVAGDLRLLVARVGGKTKAMLYRQVVPGTKEPEPFISPVKRVSIDRIDDVSDAVQVASSPLSPAPGTYADEVVYEFSVPLATLGLSPSDGMKSSATWACSEATASRPPPASTGTTRRPPSSATSPARSNYSPASGAESCSRKPHENTKRQENPNLQFNHNEKAIQDSR